MKGLTRYLLVFVGCLFIALAYNFLIIPNNLVTFGATGISAILYYLTGINPAINLIIINVITLLLASLVLKEEIIKDYMVPSILLPVLIVLTQPLTKLYTLDLPELMLVLLVAAYISGYGYSIIYKQGFSAGVSFLVEEAVGKITRFHSKMYSWIIDVLLIIVCTILYGYQIALYSLVIILISKYMITKARFGINDSKMFYIITSKEKEVKHFIIHDLKCELSVLDVKGGFTKKKNQILLTVLPTNDYYKLKEGVKIIDDKAFIAITDTYDVVNRKTF